MNIIDTIEGFEESAKELPWIVQQVVTLVYELVINFVNRVIDVVLVIFGFAEDLSYGAIGQETLSKIIMAMVVVASSFLAILFLKEVIVSYIFKMKEEEEPLEKLVKLSVAIAVMNCAPTIHETLLDLCSKTEQYLVIAVVNSNLKSFKKQADGSFDIAGSMKKLLSSGANEKLLGRDNFGLLDDTTKCFVILFALSVLLIFVVFFAVNVIKVLFRGIELTIYELFMPIMAIDIITDNRAMFKEYFKSYIVTMFGFIIQQILMILAFVVFSQDPIDLISSLSDTEEWVKFLINPIMGCIMLYFASNGTKWLRQFTYTSGAGGFISAGIQKIGGNSKAAQVASSFVKNV